jgi:hypothetical protein
MDGAHWERVGHSYPANRKNSVLHHWTDGKRVFAILKAPGANGWVGQGQTGYNEGFLLLVSFKSPANDRAEGVVLKQETLSRQWRKTVAEFKEFALRYPAVK